MLRIALLTLLLLLPLAPLRAEPPAEAIGRLNYAGYKASRHCTAFLTGAREAVTAAHCLERLQAGDLHLLLGYDKGAWREHLRPGSVEPAPDGRDLARICLKSPASAQSYPWSDTPPRRGETLVVLGYGRPRIHAQSRRDCPVLAASAREVTLDCAVAPGTSGAPVLRRTEAGYEVVAVVSAARAGTAIAVRPPAEPAAESCGG